MCYSAPWNNSQSSSETASRRASPSRELMCGARTPMQIAKRGFSGKPKGAILRAMAAAAAESEDEARGAERCNVRQRVVRYRSPSSFRAPSFGRKEPHTTRAASAPCRFATLRTQNGDSLSVELHAFEFIFAARIDAARTRTLIYI